jgi:hypothetical protein
MREDMGDDEFRRIVGLPENFDDMEQGFYWIRTYDFDGGFCDPRPRYFNGDLFEIGYEREDWMLPKEVYKIGPRIQVPENF